MAIEIKKSGSFDTFSGTVKKVETTEGKTKDGEKTVQIMITISTPDTKKGVMYEWVGLPDSATDDSLPEGSNAAKYYQDISVLVPDVKKATTVFAAFKALEGRNFQWVKKTYGKTFKGNNPKEFWVPLKEL